MSGDWKCRKCGKINVEFIGTCECGGLKEDGIQTDENKIPDEQDKREEKRKWQCPECFKINDRDFCSCGYVRTDACGYLDEGTDTKKYLKPKKKKHTKVAIIISAVVVVLLLLVGKIVFPGGVYSNLDSIVLNSDLSNGAVFNTSFSDAKKIIGIKIGLGGISNSSSGWFVDFKSSKTTEYTILDNQGTLGSSVLVDTNGRVVGVSCTTSINAVNDTQIRQFSEAFAEIAGATPDSVESILKDLYDKSGGKRQAQHYSRGVYLDVIPQDGYYTFKMCAITKENYIKGCEIGK